MTQLTVIGAGAWGTALAAVAHRASSRAILWARDPAIADAVNTRHENPVYLPGIRLDPTIRATADVSAALSRAGAALVVVPTQFLREVLGRFTPHLSPGLPLLLCAKGIETGSLKTMSELAAEIAPRHPIAVLSGPSFAAEVARDLPTAVTIASHDAAAAELFTAALGGRHFRPYLSADPVGVEIGGAVKNVLAIACGIVDGLGLGDNARAALITRGLAEMTRLGIAKGARAETFAGLSGLGDLVLTCGGAQSRNHTLGVSLGRGESLAEALAGRRSVVEGVASATAVAALAAKHRVEMPIVDAVDAVLHRGMAIAPMIEGLLARPRRAE
ncbi:MAG TPA: NAD(P)H-dependent glycerol-3-phosphate dehydrogenase [Stellaceae bacterium]|jgi:glycerol-3-phosphate dehydrogenase (NAD(P)+)|nr:NAD(P)H-dependent glycerol-3-phosphate dehydrogenase [Stellaceae bacterium]